MLMHLRFDVKKAVQAAGVILRAEGKRIGRKRLLKLLLIADRKSIEKSGRPILGSKISAFDEGPLHSDVYDLIKGNHADEPFWSKFFTRQGPRDVLLTDEPGVDLLSRQEIDLLTETVDKHGQFDDDALSELTHQFPEWKEHYVPRTSRPIPLESMIEAVGHGPDKEAIIQDLKDDQAFDNFFAKYS